MPGFAGKRRAAGALCVTALVVSVALSACGVGGAGSSPAPTPPFEITGHWTGTLHQLGLGSLAVDAKIRSLKRSESAPNTVSYTVIDCSGTWSFHTMAGRSFEFKETIDSGSGGSCKGSGTVTLTPARRDQLDYSFSGGGVESRGTLSRVG